MDYGFKIGEKVKYKHPQLGTLVCIVKSFGKLSNGMKVISVEDQQGRRHEVFPGNRQLEKM